jgi:3-oxoadipate enol-lactonase
MTWIAYVAACGMLGTLDQRGKLNKLALPVTITVGDQDAATPVAVSEFLHAGISGSKLVILNGLHLTPLECPAEVTTDPPDLARHS